MKSKVGVYKILNTVNGKCYVGSSIHLTKRWNNHRSMLRLGTHDNIHLQAAWNKYSETAFAFSVIEFCERANLLAVEQKWIDALDVYASGYNRRPLASSCMGTKYDDARRERHRAIMSSPEVRAKLSKVRRGAVLSEEHRAKISLGCKGRIITDEARENYRRAAKGRIISPEQRAKIAASKTGKGHSIEARQKISAALRARPPISDETREKLRRAAKARFKYPKTDKNQMSLLDELGPPTTARQAFQT